MKDTKDTKYASHTEPIQDGHDTDKHSHLELPNATFAKTSQHASDREPSPEHSSYLPPASQNEADNGNSLSIGDSDDEYVVSDEERIVYGKHYSSLGEHAAFFSQSLAHAMDSLELDKSLVLQAKLSGQLNNENQRIVEKKEQLVEHLRQLKEMYRLNFVPGPSGKSKAEQMASDLKELERRLHVLKNGSKKVSLFGSSKSMGLAADFPVEYNQARDRVLERQIPSEERFGNEN